LCKTLRTNAKVMDIFFFVNLFKKVPKREIFVTELFILTDPIWIGDLRSKPKNPFVKSVRLIFAICGFSDD
jgi:hypothetical protein